MSAAALPPARINSCRHPPLEGGPTVECRTQRILKAEIHTVDIKNSTAVRCGVVDDIVLCVEDVTLAVKGEQNRTEQGWEDQVVKGKEKLGISMKNVTGCETSHSHSPVR
jgi:hypothetical protein